MSTSPASASAIASADVPASASGGNSSLAHLSSLLGAAGNGGQTQAVAARAGSGRKRKPSAVAMEAAAEQDGTSDVRIHKKAHTAADKQTRRGSAATEQSDVANAAAVDATEAADSGEPFSVPPSPSTMPRVSPASGVAAAAASSIAAAVPASGSAAAAARPLQPPAHALISYTDVTAQSTSMYLVPVSAITADESELLQSLHGCGVTCNGVAQLALERMLKKNSVRACPGGPLTFGREFHMDDGLPATAAASSAAAAATGGQVNPASPSSSSAAATRVVPRGRLAKGFHNFWVDKSIVSLYLIRMVADERPLGEVGPSGASASTTAAVAVAVPAPITPAVAVSNSGSSSQYGYMDLTPTWMMRPKSNAASIANAIAATAVPYAQPQSNGAKQLLAILIEDAPVAGLPSAWVAVPAEQPAPAAAAAADPPAATVAASADSVPAHDQPQDSHGAAVAMAVPSS